MCEHPLFEASVNIRQTTNSRTAEVQVVCSECRLPFKFVGKTATLQEGRVLIADIEPTHDQLPPTESTTTPDPLKARP